MVENFSAIDGKLFYHWWKTMSTVFHHQWWKTIDTVFHHWQKTIETVFHHWQKMILQWRTCLGHRSVLSESPRPTESKWAQQKLCTNRSMTTILGYDSQSKCALFSMLIGTFFFPSSVWLKFWNFRWRCQLAISYPTTVVPSKIKAKLNIPYLWCQPNEFHFNFPLQS